MTGPEAISGGDQLPALPQNIPHNKTHPTRGDEG